MLGAGGNERVALYRVRKYKDVLRSVSLRGLGCWGTVFVAVPVCWYAEKRREMKWMKWNEKLLLWCDFTTKSPSPSTLRDTQTGNWTLLLYRHGSVCEHVPDVGEIQSANKPSSCAEVNNKGATRYLPPHQWAKHARSRIGTTYDNHALPARGSDSKVGHEVNASTWRRSC